MPALQREDSFGAMVPNGRSYAMGDGTRQRHLEPKGHERQACASSV